MKKPRHLSPEERALWDSVARQAKPLDRLKAKLPEPQPKPVPKPPEKPPLPQIRMGQGPSAPRGHDLAPSIETHLSAHPVRMDRKQHTRLKRGKLEPEARIDLHGMTLDRAHTALIGFVLRAESQGKRLILVITGKGKDRDDGGPIPTRLGVLRHQVPHWLQLPPLAQLILQVTPASQKHGGHGAYYVYLKRRR